jgi:hypothetical protein
MWFGTSQQLDCPAGTGAQVFAQSESMLQAPHWPPLPVVAVVEPVVAEVVFPPLEVDEGDVVTEPDPPEPPVLSLFPDAQARKRAGPKKANAARGRTFFTVCPNVLQAFHESLRECASAYNPSVGPTRHERAPGRHPVT